MTKSRPMASIMRAEARVLSVAGMLLLAASFPFTLFMVSIALAAKSAAPWAPAVAGAPPLLLGYLMCHVAARRLVRARQLDRGQS